MGEHDLATVVRELREALGLTQEGLARELGVTVSTVFRWEKGRSQPSGLACRALERLRSSIGGQPGGTTTPVAPEDHR
jgi:putative transcriptional regulator